MFSSSRPWLETYPHHNISPFFPWDIPKDRPNHNDHVHPDVFIHNAQARPFLIDGGVELNIYTTKFVKGLGYSKQDVDPSCRITIKYYDDGEHFSKGVNILPIRFGPATENIIF